MESAIARRHEDRSHTVRNGPPAVAGRERLHTRSARRARDARPRDRVPQPILDRVDATPRASPAQCAGLEGGDGCPGGFGDLGAHRAADLAKLATAKVEVETPHRVLQLTLVLTPVEGGEGVGLTTSRHDTHVDAAPTAPIQRRRGFSGCSPSSASSPRPTIFPTPAARLAASPRSDSCFTNP